jgi:hypothetical protein
MLIIMSNKAFCRIVAEIVSNDYDLNLLLTNKYVGPIRSVLMISSNLPLLTHLKALRLVLTCFPFPPGELVL